MIHPHFVTPYRLDDQSALFTPRLISEPFFLFGSYRKIDLSCHCAVSTQGAKIVSLPEPASPGGDHCASAGVANAKPASINKANLASAPVAHIVARSSAYTLAYVGGRPSRASSAGAPPFLVEPLAPSPDRVAAGGDDEVSRSISECWR